MRRREERKLSVSLKTLVPYLFEAANNGNTREDFPLEHPCTPGDLALVLEDLPRFMSDAVTTDGEHHKQWYLETIAKAFGIELPEHAAGIPA